MNLTVVVKILEAFENLPQYSGDSCFIEYSMAAITCLNTVLDYVQ